MEKYTTSDYLTIKEPSCSEEELEETMWKQVLRALAIAMVAGISTIAAANARLSVPSVRQPADILSLTHYEKGLAWRDLHRQAIHHYGVPWFRAD
jgi:hypothetical protein